MESASPLRQTLRAAGKLPEELSASVGAGRTLVARMVDQSRRKVGWAQSGQGCQFPLQLGNARSGGDGNAKLPAGFHDDQGNIAIDEPALELGAGEPKGFHHAPGRVGHDQLEDGLWKTRTPIWRKKQGESIPSLNRTAHSRLCRLWASSQRQR